MLTKKATTRVTKKSTPQSDLISLEELKRKRKPILNANRAHRSRLSHTERVAVWVTHHVGTMEFFLVIFFWTVSWLTWNTLGPNHLRFDPFPAFVLWLFISNMLQIFLMPLIMVGQNLQARHAEVRAESDFEVNIKSEHEITSILARLEAQDKILEKIVRKLERKK